MKNSKVQTIFQKQGLERPIYLDYMATTPVDPRVIQKMLDCMTFEGNFGNSSSSHFYGYDAEQAIILARDTIAQVIHGDPNGIVFTSGATESINLALKGATSFYQRQGKHIITTQIEHKAVSDTCHYLKRQGFSFTFLPVQPNGLLDINVLKNALREDTILVSIGHVNNEIGVIQDIRAIGEWLREQGVLFHVDAAQSIGKVEVDVTKMKIDLLSLSAHKAYGPKGIGALYVRQNPKIHLEPMIHGGKQQKGIRSGTLPTHLIVGMGEAFCIAHREREAESEHLLKLRNRLWEGICDIPGISVNGSLLSRVGNNLHLNFYHTHRKDQNLLERLSDLAISRASACIVFNRESSHVLQSLGLKDEEALHCFRLSLGRFTTEQEIEYTIRYLRETC